MAFRLVAGAAATLVAFTYLAVAQGQQPSDSSKPVYTKSPKRQQSSAEANSGFLAPGEDPQNRLFTPFLRHLAGDQKEFWTAPFHMRSDDWKAAVPFAAFTGGLIAGDKWLSDQVPDSPSQLKRSQDVSNYAAYALVASAGGAYLWGHLTHNDHLRETGFLSGEAALNSAGITFLLKSLTQRPRPLEPHAGEFFQGGNSFTSEHTAIAWSVASVVAHEYPGPLTQIAAYGLASAVTLTRVTGKQHFPSEVVIGSALGWYFGRQVYRAHHDPELGGTAWGNLVEGEDSVDVPPIPQHMGSPYVPLDSWVYPALERLAALGYVKSAFVAQKPWTRIECAMQVSEAGELTGVEQGGIAQLERKLQTEFAYELKLLDGGSNRRAELESVYARTVSISGPPLMDSYHLGQTISSDFGRPFRQGPNGQVGTSMWAALGPFTVYVRGEFQHAPSSPPLSDAVRNVIAERDSVPLPPATPFDAVNRPHLLDAYAAVNLRGWQISAGKQSLDWGPGRGDSLIWSDNVDPIEMVRVVSPAFHLPILGDARVDQFFGTLRGHTFIPHPYIYGQKINFKPLPALELGFARTITIGGHGGDPLNFRNFFRSFFGRPDSTGSVPGDSHASMDWTFHVPKTRNSIIFYGELYADDDPIPLQNLPKNAFRPGIYITRFPHLPKLDLHIEAADTTSPGFFNFGSSNHGNLNYWNQKYRDGYTNEGNLIGSSVGRMGRSVQGWLTYWMSSSSTIEFSFKHNMVSSDFIPGGGSWQDYQLRYNKSLRSGLYLKNWLQIENISRYPILQDMPRKNLTAVIEFGWAPRHE